VSQHKLPKAVREARGLVGVTPKPETPAQRRRLNIMKKKWTFARWFQRNAQEKPRVPTHEQRTVSREGPRHEHGAGEGGAERVRA